MALPFNPPVRNRLLALALLAFSAFCVAYPRPWHSSVRGTVHAAALPPQAAFATAHDAFRTALDRIANLWHAAERIEHLEHENRTLRETIARWTDEAHIANRRLRNFKGFEEFRHAALSRPVRVLPANVVGADPSPWRHNIIVDRGSTHGLRIGSPAVWGNSIVGTVVALRPTAASVRLLNDPLAGLKVRIARTGYVGLLRGTTASDAHLQLKWLTLDEQPTLKGDLVVTSELDPNTPPGLCAGAVSSVSKTRRHLFYDIKVRPLLDLDRLTEVLLVLYSADDIDDLRGPENPAEAP